MGRRKRPRFRKGTRKGTGIERIRILEWIVDTSFLNKRTVEQLSLSV